MKSDNIRLIDFIMVCSIIAASRVLYSDYFAEHPVSWKFNYRNMAKDNPTTLQEVVIQMDELIKNSYSSEQNYKELIIFLDDASD